MCNQLVVQGGIAQLEERALCKREAPIETRAVYIYIYIICLDSRMPDY